MKSIEKTHVLEIAGVICREYGITLNDLQSSRRYSKTVVLPRQLIWALVRDIYGAKISLRELGEIFGGKDHATVIHGCKAIANLCETDKKFRSRYYSLKLVIGKARAEKPPKTEDSLMDQLSDVLRYKDAVSMKISLRKVIADLKPILQS
jgi:hypothetical protein